MELPWCVMPSPQTIVQNKTFPPLMTSSQVFSCINEQSKQQRALALPINGQLTQAQDPGLFRDRHQLRPLQRKLVALEGRNERCRVRKM